MLKETAVLISPELAKAFNEQIGHEFGASMQYLAIAAHFYQRSLTLLAKLFEQQAEEEKQHAMKFIKYLQDTKGGLHIPAIPAPKAEFATAEEAVQAALNWEKDVTAADHRADGAAPSRRTTIWRRAFCSGSSTSSSKRSSRWSACSASSSSPARKTC